MADERNLRDQDANGAEETRRSAIYAGLDDAGEPERAAQGQQPREGGAPDAGTSTDPGAPAPRTGAKVIIAVVAVVSAILIAVSAFALAGGFSGPAADQASSAAEAASEASSAASDASSSSASSAADEAGGDEADEAGDAGSSAAGKDGAQASDGGGSASGGEGDTSATTTNKTITTQSTTSSGGSPSSSGSGSSAKPAAKTVKVLVDSSAAGSPVSYSVEVPFRSGMTVYDALAESGISYNARQSTFGIYVTSIGGLAEKDYGGASGWTYYVNGSFVNTACDSCKLSSGDVLTWVYVTERN